MKPFWMIFIGGSNEGQVEAGKRYKIIEKIREKPFYPGCPVWYSYVFIDDQGNRDQAHSKLFVPIKKARKAA